MILGFLALSSGMIFLGGCAAGPCPPARPMAPPAVYLQDVPEPEFRGRTNGGLLAWALELREAVRMGNADKRAIREWMSAWAREARH